MNKFSLIEDLNSRREKISFNGVLDSRSFSRSGFPIHGSVHSTQIINEILATELEEFIDEVKSLSFDRTLDLSEEGGLRLEVLNFSNKENNRYSLIFYLNYDFSYWARSYSMISYWNAILDSFNDKGIEEISVRNPDGREDFSFSNGLDICIDISISNRTLQSYIDEYLPVIKNLIVQVGETLSKPKNGFNIEFDFPSEIKAPCEQYLIYFAQFMMDLGVKIDNEISHENGKTIFSVIPENKDEALGNIRDALSAYVNLPQKDINPAFDPSKDIAVSQLEFNVNNLNNQLQLVKSTMIAYEHTIQAQKIALDVFQSKEQSNTLLISKEPEKEDDIESVFGNLFQVKKYDKNGVVIDYPEIVRALKRKFS